MSHHIVRARPRWQSLLIRASMVFLALLIAWGLYEYGRYRAGFDLLAANEQKLEQQRQVDELRDENTRLREQRAILERSGGVEQEAYKQLQSTVGGLQDELLELKEELAFYRGIISPEDASKGLKLQSFTLSPGRGKGHYGYKMVLTQVLNNGTVAYGNIAMTVSGSENGEEREYTLAQLGEDSDPLQFRFKYFQSFEGDITLPEGFIPSKVNLVVKPRSRTHKQLSESINWMVQEI